MKLARPHLRQQKKNRRKINVAALKDPEVLQDFRQRMDINLSEAGHKEWDDVNQAWSALKSAIIRTCEESIGRTKREHQDWFDDNDLEIQNLTDIKC